MLAPATSAPTAVEQFRDSQHHEVLSGHGINLSGELATFTFDVTWHVHAVDNGTTFQAAYSESFKYTLVRPGHLQQLGDSTAEGVWDRSGPGASARCLAIGLAPLLRP